MSGMQLLNEKFFITYLSLCLRLMLERRLERAENESVKYSEGTERLNSLVLYRHETEDKSKLYWQEIPKDDRLLMERLGIKIPSDICNLEAGILEPKVLNYRGPNRGSVLLKPMAYASYKLKSGSFLVCKAVHSTSVRITGFSVKRGSLT